MDKKQLYLVRAGAGVTEPVNYLEWHEWRNIYSHKSMQDIYYTALMWRETDVSGSVWHSQLVIITSGNVGSDDEE